MTKNTPKLRFKEFTDEWQEKKLGDLGITVSDGNYGEKYPKASEMKSSGVPFIRANNIKGSRLVWDDMKYITPELHSSLTSGHLKPGDILVTTRGDIGTVANVTQEFEGSNINAQICLLRVDSNLSCDFLYQYLGTSFGKTQFRQLQSGSALKQLPKEKLGCVKISIPTKEEQEKIAGFLGAVDEKIGRLEEVKKGFEKYKKGVMQAIFSQKIRFKKPDGSNFTDWEEKKLGELCKITTGKLNANAMVPNGEYRFYTCAKDFYQIDKYAFDTEALLVSGNGANVGYIHYYQGKFNAYQRTYVLDKFSENIFFIKYVLQKDLSQRIQVEKKEGNTPYIVLDTLAKMKILLPDMGEQEKIAGFLISLDNKVDLINKHLEQTKLFKKSLLQQMFV